MIPDDEKSGLYSLECRDCPGIYIGETGRKLITMVSEHLSSGFSSSFGKSSFRAMTNLSILNVFTPDHDLITKVYTADVDNE